MIDKIRGVEDEKDKVSEDTEKSVKKNVDETLQDVNKTFEVKKKAPEEAKQTLNVFFGIGVAAFKSFSNDAQKSTLEGLKKMKNKADGKETEQFTFNEAAGTGAFVMASLLGLKKQYPKKADFLKKLKEIKTASKYSKYPLAKLLNTSTLALFKIANPAKAIDLLTSMKVDIGEAWAVKDSFEKLGSKNLNSAAKKEIVDFLKKNILKKTSKPNLRKVVKIIHTMVKNDVKEIQPEVLTNLTFLVDERDYTELINFLVGKRSEQNYVAANDNKIVKEKDEKLA